MRQVLSISCTAEDANVDNVNIPHVLSLGVSTAAWAGSLARRAWKTNRLGPQDHID